MILWRLTAARHAASAFSGDGARLYGGRWSPVGVPVVYCAESRSLALLEVLAGTDDPARLFQQPWVLISAEVPDECIDRPAGVPDSWRNHPHSSATQAFGAEWVRARRSSVLRVPSAVVPGEFNFLLNPAHPDFKRVKIGGPQPFSFDPRLA